MTDSALPPETAVRSALRERIAAVCREMGSSRLVLAGAGNVSARTTGGLLITPRGSRLAGASAEEIVFVPDGADEADDGRVSSELAIHRSIYAATDAGAVVHTHSHFAAVLSAVVDVVPPVHYSLAGLGDEVRVARYATFGTRELAEHAVEALGANAAVLLRNHGAVTLGATVEHALERAVLLEWLCSVAYHARLYGDPRLIDAAEIGRVRDQSRRLDYSLTDAP
jgi:L-fuculose-phosphate aldolase